MSSKNKKLLAALGVAAVVVLVIAAVLLGKGGQTTTVDPASTPSDVSAVFGSGVTNRQVSGVHDQI